MNKLSNLFVAMINKISDNPALSFDDVSDRGSQIQLYHLQTIINQCTKLLELNPIELQVPMKTENDLEYAHALEAAELHEQERRSQALAVALEQQPIQQLPMAAQNINNGAVQAVALPQEAEFDEDEFELALALSMEGAAPAAPQQAQQPQAQAPVAAPDKTRCLIQ